MTVADEYESSLALQREVLDDLAKVSVVLESRSGKKVVINIDAAERTTLEDFSMETDVDWIEADRFIDYEPSIPRWPARKRFMFGITQRFGL